MRWQIYIPMQFQRLLDTFIRFLETPYLLHEIKDGTSFDVPPFSALDHYFAQTSLQEFETGFAQNPCKISAKSYDILRYFMTFRAKSV